MKLVDELVVRVSEAYLEPQVVSVENEKEQRRNGRDQCVGWLPLVSYDYEDARYKSDAPSLAGHVLDAIRWITD